MRPDQISVNWLERELPDPNDQRAYARERAYVAVSEAIGEHLEHANLSRTDLAAKLGVSKGWISRAVRGQNLTLRSIADILWACGMELEDLKAAKLGVSIVDEPIADLVACAPSSVTSATEFVASSLERVVAQPNDLINRLRHSA
jgi:transcriptional regulator with XRE-family HTH domain